ncbi:hypothetical protein GGX14DRAFT_653894 [Mycena pura]|uniref:F-box domain-containing protein n=1 Tax=Mycena pura TaxID=153505 RepID=A0AAD6V8F5_9AGAR|nr:hypothetical protein GGX14DRAFT_653894 [Mycena pura]
MASSAHHVTVEEERSAIDNQLAWHYAQIAVLTEKHNAFVPILRLSNELLARILTIYAAESDCLFNLKWTRVLFVCRRWHELALASAARPLWSFIAIRFQSFNCSVHRVSTQLRRSGDYPLTIKIKLYESNACIDSILNQAERIRSLHVTGVATYVYHLIDRLTALSLPILHSLTLDPSYKQDELPGSIVKALPDVIFDGKLPNLCELTLTSIAFPWRLMGNLVALCLSHSDNSVKSTPSNFPDLMLMLESCPRLRTLELDSVLPSPGPHEHHSPVDLPFLELLHLHETVATCTALLAYLRFPSTSTVELKPQNVHIGADIKDVLIPLHKCIRSRIISALRIVAFWIEEDSGREGYCVMSFNFHTPARRSGSLTLTCHPRNQRTVRQIMKKAIKTSPSLSITHLDIECATNISEASWKGALKLLRAVQLVRLQAHGGGLNFVRALSAMETADPLYTTFPRILHLHTRVSGSQRWKDMIPDFLHALEDYLRTRLAKRNMLETLELKDDLFRYLLKHEEEIERLFYMMQGAGTLLYNGALFDPVQAREEREKMEDELRDLWEME